MSGVDTLPLTSAAAPGAALPATPTEARRWTEVALLTLLVAAGVTVALAGAARDAALNPVAVPTLPHWILGPLTSLAPSLSGAQAMIVIAAMGVSYVGLLALGPTLSARRVLVAVAVLYVAFALTAPLISTDVYNYIDYGRLGALHGLDPYVATPAAVPTDPVYHLAGWHDTPSAYGPLFTWLSYGLALFGPAGALWTFKALAALSGLGCIALVWVLARRLARPAVFAAAAFGLNPVVLVWGVGAAHNDLLMLALMLAGAALVLAAREALGGAALVAAAAVKLTAGLALPFVALAGSRRWRVLAGAGAGVLALALGAYASFADHADDMIAVVWSGQHESGAGSVPAGVAALLGTALSPAVRAGLTGVLVVIVLWQLLRVWRGADWTGACGWAFLALVATTVRAPVWYAIWPLPLAVLSRDRRLLVMTLALQAYLVVNALPVLANWP